MPMLIFKSMLNEKIRKYRAIKAKLDKLNSVATLLEWE